MNAFVVAPIAIGAVIIAAAVLYRRLAATRMSRLTGGWLLIPARVVGKKVRIESSHRRLAFHAELNYAYLYGGHNYSGCYSCLASTEPLANHLLAPYEPGMEIHVRVDSNNIGRSIFREKDNATKEL